MRREDMNKNSSSSASSRGSIFLVLFGALGVLGILGVGMTTFIKGPLSSSVKLTRSNTAQSQMALAAQSTVMAATGMAGSGDCDNDGSIEPVEWRVDGTKPFPAGGGLVPLGIGVTNTKDPWGNEYGYCAWDHGTVVLNAGCQQGTPGTNRRLQGAALKQYPVVALISSGPDKTFTTTCRNFTTADVNANGVLGDVGDLELVSKAAASDDDLIFSYTYEEATGASGGLWSLKSSDANTAVIGKAIEAPSAKFTGTSMMSSLGYMQSSAVSCTGLGNVSYNDPSSGNCYYSVTSTTATWQEAQAACQANGAYLAVIGSSAENTTVFNNVAGGGTASWLGASDIDSEGVWRWAGGELKGVQFWQGEYAANGGQAVGGNYSNWFSGRPEGLTIENCLRYNNSVAWNDDRCEIPRTYICEKTGFAPLTMQSGLKIADASVVTTCNSTNTGVLRRVASGANLEMCDGVDWKAAGGGSNATLIDHFSDGVSNYVRNNIFLGKNAGGEATSGGGNIFLVSDNYATTTLTTGSGNSVFGKNVSRNITTGSANTVMGVETMANSPTANRTTAFGNYACSKLLNGTANNDNTCIGTAALLDKVSTQVTSIGRYSGYNTTGAVRAVWLGGDAGNRNTTGVDNTAIGNYALDAVTTNGSNTALGYASLTAVTGGPNTGVGSGALGSNTSGNNNTAIGMSSLGAQTTTSFNTAIGYNAARLINNGLASGNVAAGYSALYASTAGTNNVAVGSYAAASLTNNTSNRNTAIGRDTMRDKAANTSDNVAIGATAVKGTGSTLNNTGIGWSALSVVRSPANVGIGYSAARLLNSTTATVNSTAVGSRALESNATGPNNTAVGYQALTAATATSSSVAVGYQTLMSMTGTTANNLTAVGYQALRSNSAATLATAVGHQAMYSNGAGINNTALGAQALYTNNLAGASNTAIGAQALYATNNAAGQNTAIGYQAGYAATGLSTSSIMGAQAAYGASGQTANNVTAFGYRSLYSTGAANIAASTAFGSQSLYTGSANSSALGFRAGYNYGSELTAAGYLALSVVGSGNNSTALGAMALTGGGTGASNNNTAVGYRSMVNAVTSGVDASHNTAIGAMALENVNATDNNVAIGYAAYDGTAAIRGTAIGALTDISGDNSTAIGYGVSVGAANTIRLGNSSITAIEGQVAWTFPSDRRLKQDIVPSDLGLDFIMGLKPVSYRLKQGNGRLDYGFLAQDVEKSLDGRETNMLIRLNDEMKTYQLRSNDLVAPIVKAIQERQKKIEELKRQVAELQKDVIPSCREAAP
ncbi:MAG: hypothetical protein DI586_04890 [Micavibrio aeruginosavorus]|uniref:Peptidase S74 domain-containing protein n=1 Tax=Micavibrio aeruginosavorus TaxID=349221 RepID=A0A2W5FJE9_9BACT|nr:MAG: hypothetical protein DI586_04890 [Micavibrio aeruginosavorus]